MPDKKEYVKLWTSYSAYFEALGDAEVGRLARAMIEYKLSGVAPKFSGNERFIWPAIQRDMDEAEAAQLAYSERQSQRGTKGGRPKKANAFSENPEKPVLFGESQKSQGLRTKDKGQWTKDNNPPLTPPQGETGFGPELQSAFEAWLAYKQEKRQGYKPVGLKSLVTEIRNNAARYGEQAVADLIRECMASNWQGIIFDRLKSGSKPGGGKQGRKSWAELAAEMDREDGA